jgi:hypothetical protein
MVKEEILSTFLLAFGGQLVTITTSLNANVGFQDDQGNQVESMPILYEGILLDIDNDYLYLGHSINEINSAVRKSHVVHISVKQETNVLEEILQSMPDPKKEDIN